MASHAIPESIFLSQCPNCAATYYVPVDRMGPAGARIRCPECERIYDFKPAPDRDRRPVRPSRERFVPEPKAEPADPLGVRSAEVVARIAIEEIGDQRARAMVAADAEGVLFGRHGAVLLDAFDRYRSRAGAAASAEVFLSALRDRLGIELPSWEARP